MFSGDLSPLYQPVLEVLSIEGEEGGALMEHPCAHWLIKKLIAVDERDGESADSGKLPHCISH